MKKKYLSCVPTNDGELAVWAGNIKEKVAIHGPTVGLAPTQIADVQGYCQTVKDGVDLVKFKKTEYEQALDARNELRATEVQNILNILLPTKRHPGYLPSIGSAMGLIGSTQVIDPELAKPTLKATVVPGKVILFFNLQMMDGVSIYCRIKGTMGWEKLCNDYESPYEDRRPLAVPHQPELREYMCRYFNRREDIGLESDIITVTFGG